MSSNSDGIEVPKQPVGEIRAGRIFWGWLWRNTIGLSMGVILGVILYGLTGFLFIGDNVPPEAEVSRNALLVGAPLGAALAGAVLGSIQQVYLSRYFVINHWLPLTTGGTALGTLWALTIANRTLFGVDRMVLSLVVLGACLGLAQWLALRRHLFRSGYWVLCCIIATLVSGGSLVAVADAVSALPNATNLLALVLLIVVIAAVPLTCALFSAITGITFVWLLRFPKQTG